MKPLVSHLQKEHPIDWEKCFQRRAPLEIEIGFGMGEFLIHSARQWADRNFIGIEQHWERISKTLRRMTAPHDSSAREASVSNIRILRTDARVAFERLFKPRSIDRIYSLFPCPWPKKGHVKHRLFSRHFLKLLNNRLKDDGEVKIVTDFYPYYEWILKQVDPKEFYVETQTIRPQFDTKFERKWLAEGQKNFFEILLRKGRHVHVPVRRDASLKTYKLDDFCYERFEFVDEKGKISVVMKDSFYDPQRKKAMIHLVVAEQELTQHVWIAVFHKRDGWRVAKAEGQNFFPTSGITKALELVYKAAERSCLK